MLYLHIGYYDLWSGMQQTPYWDHVLVYYIMAQYDDIDICRKYRDT